MYKTKNKNLLWKLFSYLSITFKSQIHNFFFFFKFKLNIIKCIKLLKCMNKHKKEVMVRYLLHRIIQ